MATQTFIVNSEGRFERIPNAKPAKKTSRDTVSSFLLLGAIALIWGVVPAFWTACGLVVLLALVRLTRNS